MLSNQRLNFMVLDNLTGIRSYCKNNNLQTRFHNHLCHRIRDALKGKSKSKHTMALLGCDINFFIEWMKYQMYDFRKLWKSLARRSCIPCAHFD